MDEFSLISFLVKNLALVIGLVLVVAAAIILPGRIRWYVLTAGLAVIAFRFIQLRLADKRLKEADKQREVLRGELDDLNQQREQLQQEVKQHNNKLNDIKTKQNELAKEANILAEKGGDIATEKDNLDERMLALVKENDELLAEVDSRETALSFFEEADQAYAELERQQ